MNTYEVKSWRKVWREVEIFNSSVVLGKEVGSLKMAKWKNHVHNWSFLSFCEILIYILYVEFICIWSIQEKQATIKW